MKFLVLLFCFFSFAIASYAQKPKDGIYTYTVAFEEWQGKSNGATCTVIIKGDSIKVINSGTGNITGNKGDVMDEGIIMKHTKTGKWIIGHSVKGKDAKEIGGCSDNPSIIDFKKKKYFIC